MTAYSVNGELWGEMGIDREVKEFREFNVLVLAPTSLNSLISLSPTQQQRGNPTELPLLL